ncbi:hypothetical protein QFC22_002917 [Naganishia vaughanmartiniae]|uniref:Uncharacterized protein n=1 Tax=Naganishia vaughanmartiniae TaxID=1424756 RepID=A0ACC2X8W1_9TREE|nr:hypothetical protein QFC22_002917 [Naganishia vaughanmartiniae]
MSFRVKSKSRQDEDLNSRYLRTYAAAFIPNVDYRSRLDWQIGKGGFGTVYAGVFSPRNGSDSGKSTGSGNSRDLQKGESLDRPLSEQVAIKLERSDHERPCLANEARALKALQGAEGIPKFHVFAHTKITVKCRPGAQLKPIGVSPPAGAGSGGAGVHGKRSPPVYKRSPLSTPVHSDFETPIRNEWSYGYGELQRQQQLSPLSHSYQPAQATPYHYGPRLIPSRPSSPSVSALVIETEYDALVMERLGEDIGTIFRRHLLKYIKPSAVPTLSGNGTSASFDSTQRRSSACCGATKSGNDIAASEGGKERVGWDGETIAWLGCHALKRLEWMHLQGFVHRDIVSRLGHFAVSRR